MQREILFRGFYPCDGPETIVVDGEKVNGRWVEGYLYVTHTGEYEIGGYCEEYNIERYTYNVLPSTVGQYTGLTDKNGKQIFEGDRLKWDAEEWGSPHTEIVEWDYDLFSAREGDWGQFCEVIGTVFDEVTP